MRKVLDFGGQRRGQVLAPDHLEESLLEADGTGDQMPRAHFAAIFEADADCFSVLDENLLDAMLQENAPTGLRERFP